MLFKFVVIIFSLSDHELVWKYVDSVLVKNSELGVKVGHAYCKSSPLHCHISEMYSTLKSNTISLPQEASIVIT